MCQKSVGPFWRLVSWATFTVTLPLWKDDGGHPMLFHTFEGKLVMAIHQPNRRVERARFFEMDDSGDRLKIVREIGGQR